MSTDPGSPDRRLRGRTYAIPFEKVWTAALRVAEEQMRGWTTLSKNDESGLIHVRSRTLVWKQVDDVHVSISLDENAQTRVDLEAGPRTGGNDFGRNARRIGVFLRKLDAALDPAPGQILDPTASGSREHVG